MEAVMCVSCNNFSGEVYQVTQEEGQPKAYSYECTDCGNVDVAQEDLDDFYQAMNDMRPD